MSDYMSAYLARLHRIDGAIRDVAKVLIEKGYKVICTKRDKLITFIHIYDTVNKRQVTLGWTEVPYRWYMHFDVTPSKETGSCVTAKEIVSGEVPCPFSIAEIIGAMRPYPKVKDYENPTYLKDISYEEPNNTSNEETNRI